MDYTYKAPQGTLYSTKVFIFIICLFLSVLGASSTAYPQNGKGQPPAKDQSVGKDQPVAEATSPIEKQKQRLAQIIKKRILFKNELKKLKTLPTTKETEERIEDIQHRLAALSKNFETVAAQIEEEKIPKKDKLELSWMDELKEITRPVLTALREATERPRKIDTLKSKIESLKGQIASYENAQENLRDLILTEQDLSKILKNEKAEGLELSQIEKKLEEKLVALQRKYDPELLHFELSEAEKNLNTLLSSEKNLFEFGTTFIGDFFKVRGRNLLIAFGTFFLFWVILTGGYRFVQKKTPLLQKLNPHYQKLLKAAYTFFILLLSSLASLFSLYFLNDWLILSMAILVFIGVALGFRHVIPKFVKELRLILNLGTVREGERLLWNGVPWLVQEIGVMAVLRNPKLQGGLLRLMVGDLIGHHSRPLVHEEEWFPTQVEDWVMLSDDTFGKVLKQTSEQVVIKSLWSQKFYLTSEYLKLKPRNLSKGFSHVIRFGLDYGIQSRICEDIPALFREGLLNHFKDRMENTPQDIYSIRVNFDSAGASSLNLIIVVKFNGHCAENFHPFKWELNKVLVHICNENGLVIPFTQMTLSPSSELKALVQSTIPAT